MKYRRMAFNAQLQDENAALQTERDDALARVSWAEAEIEGLQKKLAAHIDDGK